MNVGIEFCSLWPECGCEDETCDETLRRIALARRIAMLTPAVIVLIASILIIAGLIAWRLFHG